MAEDQSTEDREELLGFEADGPRFRGPLSPWVFVAIVIGVVLVAGGLFALSHFSGPGSDPRVAQRAALSQSWKAAQKDRAQGVDFELSVSNAKASDAPALSFQHSGSVSLVDKCFEASSKYIVLKNGSLVVKDLSHARTLGAENCSSKAPDVFLLSKLSYGGKSWTAYGADGKKIISGFVEGSK